MTRFEVGDQVRVIDKHRKQYGLTGRVEAVIRAGSVPVQVAVRFPPPVDFRHFRPHQLQLDAITALSRISE